MKPNVTNIVVTKQPGYVKPELPGGKEWVAALRSGKYLQGFEGDLAVLASQNHGSRMQYEVYHRTDKDYDPAKDPMLFCCLGVKAFIDGDLILSGNGRRMINSTQGTGTLSDTCTAFPYLKETGGFPTMKEIVDGGAHTGVYAGLVKLMAHNYTGEIKECNSLAALNDFGASFLMIACIVEQLWECL